MNIDLSVGAIADSENRNRIRLLMIGGLVIAVVVATLTFASRGSADEAKVVRIVDGDTLIVRYNDEDRRVRLLNVDTPETKDPNAPVECLGPEATAELERLLPAGSEVRLEFDKELRDRYGRDLAAVYLSDGRLANAELARAGLGVPVQFGNNSKYLHEVESGRDEAMLYGRGFFDSEEECTVAAQVNAAKSALDTAMTAPVGTTSSGAMASATALAAAILIVENMGKKLNAKHRALSWLVYSGDALSLLSEEMATQVEVGKAQKSEIDVVVEKLKKAESRERAEAKAEAEAKARAEAMARANQRAQTPAAPKAPAANPKPSNPSGYTGPRCYAPGGRTWKPC